MTITAKFGGTCLTCGGYITAGERVMYEPGQGIRHPRGGCKKATQTTTPPAPVERKPDEPLRDDAKLLGKAQYKGHEYLLLWEGQTKRGTSAAKLAFRDGSKTFWADAGEYSVTKRYQDAYHGPMTLGKLNRMADEFQAAKNETAASAKVAAATAAIPPERLMAMAGELAEKAGVELIADAKPASCHAGEKVTPGETRKQRTGYMLVIAVGKYERYYVSRQDLDDMDDDNGQPGWKENQQYTGIRCSEPVAVRAERERKEAAQAAKNAKAQAEIAAWKSALAQIPADYRTRHGALYGGTVTMVGGNGQSVSIAEPGLDASNLPWVKVASHETRVDDPRSSIDGRVQDCQTLYTAGVPDGRAIYYVHHYGSFGDDLRVTYYLPEDLWQQMLLAEIQARGITPESAEQWLSQSRGCVGTELYEFAATLRPAPVIVNVTRAQQD